MRIIVNGQQAFGKASLEAVLDRGEDEVVAVYCAPDKPGRSVDPIKEYALEKGLEVVQPPNYTDADVLDKLRSFKADLCVMAYMIIFVPREARDIPTHGSICFHPSLLPRHRGPSSINWPIIAGATRSGLTIFWPNDGLDEGEILLQREIDIAPDDTLGSVYFNKIFPLGIAAVLDAIDLVRSGNPPRIVQDETLATYESWCRKADAEIDWSKPVDDVYNLIRGTNPQPGAWTTLGDGEIQIFDVEKASGSSKKPGEVTAVGENTITVSAMDGLIMIKRVRVKGGQKVAAGEFAGTTNIKVGTQLGV